HRGTTNTVGSGRGTEQNHLVARAGRLGQLDVLVLHHTHAQGVDQRVSEVVRTKADLTPDVGQAKTVAVGGDARNHTGQHTPGVVGIGRAEPQSTHDGDRAGPHGEDVANDTAHTGGRTLMGFDEGRTVVRLDLERDRTPVTDVD